MSSSKALCCRFRERRSKREGKEGKAAGFGGCKLLGHIIESGAILRVLQILHVDEGWQNIAKQTVLKTDEGKDESSHLIGESGLRVVQASKI